MSDVKVSKEIDYTVTQTVTPKYTIAKITPNTTNTSIVIGAASTQDLRFELPTKAFNLAKSYLAYDVKFAAVADTTTCVNLDVPPLLSGVTLMPRASQTPLVNITNYLPHMMKTILPREMKKEDYLVRDSTQYFYPSNEFVATPMVGVPRRLVLPANAIGIQGPDAGVLANAYGAMQIVAGTSAIEAKASAAALSSTSANVYTSVNPAVATVATTGVVTAAANNTVALTGNITSCGYPATVNLLENKHLYIDTKTNNAVEFKNRRVYLSDLKGTMFELDRDLIFPDVLTLTFTMGYANRHAFSLTNAATVPAQDATTNYSPYSGDTTISNLCLYLFVESEPSIVRQLEAVLENKMGYEIAVPMTTINQQAYDSGTAQNISISITNNGRGARLKRIYHTVFDNLSGQNYAQLALDNSNSTNFQQSAKINDYYTMLNSDRLQSFNVDCTKDEDWAINQPYLKDKAILMNKNHYKYFWSHVDDFTEGHDVENGMTGMPMTMNSYKWDLQSNMTSRVKMLHFTFIIINRLVNISKGGVVIL